MKPTFTQLTLTQMAQKQRGAVLVVSLVILLVLTILGVSVMSTTTLEEKMAAAARNKDLAFQAAETAIREAEIWLSSATPNAAQFSPGCAGGLCTVSTSATPRWEDATLCGTGSSVWAGGCSRELTGLSGVAAQPRYIVEMLQSVGGSANNPMLSNLGDFPAESASTYYRITALGFGGTLDARVILQSTFGI